MSNVCLSLLLLSLFVLEYFATCTDEEIDLISHHPAWKFIPTKDCGITRFQHSAGRIINGKEAKLGQFPWIVQLGYSSYSPKPVFNCGGSLITPKYVITAGHCGVDHDIVRVGEHNTVTDLDCDEHVCTTYQDIKIKEHIFNDFDSDTYINDICLILLAEAAKLNDFVRPICLPRGKVLKLDLIDKNVQIAGWGYTNSTSASLPEILQYVTVPIVAQSNCNIIYKHSLNENQICAGFPHGKDSCNGDSGGPLTKKIKISGNKRHCLIGIVSFGRHDCGEGPAVYTRVSKYINRILDNIKE